MGRSGQIVNIDATQIDRPLILIEFYNPENLQLSRWWYTLNALCSPPATSTDVTTMSTQNTHEEQTQQEKQEKQSETTFSHLQLSTVSMVEMNFSICEIALGRMYAQRLLLESWTQTREHTSNTKEKEDLILNASFFVLVINDCFGPLHATAQRSSENSGHSSSSGITTGIEGKYFKAKRACIAYMESTVD